MSVTEEYRIMPVLVPALGITAAYLLAVKPSGRRKWLNDYKIRLFAHRGLFDNHEGIPENSLAAFRRAADYGYGIELDVRLTKDNVPILMHDAKTDRMVRDERGDRVIGLTTDYTLEQMKRFHLLDTEEPVPTLAEALELINGKVPVIVEIKSEDMDPSMPVCEYANQVLSNYKGQYLVESFNPFAVAWYHKNRPDVIRGQLSEAFLKDPKYRTVAYFSVQYLLLNVVTSPDFIAYNVQHWRNLSRRITKDLYRAPAVTWTIRSQKKLDQLRDKYDLFIFEGFLPDRNKETE